MNIRLFFSLLIGINFNFSAIIFCQNDLYIPKNILKAYQNGTRSPDGKPGDNYWQNSADYKINVEVQPESKMLFGGEYVTYFNNSPDSLYLIIIRLYQNIFKKGSARDVQFNPDAINDGVQITRLLVKEDTIDINDNNFAILNSTNLAVKLTHPLPPNSKINLQVDWNFEIPGIDKLRMGAYDSTSFFISLWYPQIAVYDDIDGWDTHNYGGYQEFYNDFNNFEIKITVPNNFCVWATGVLQNPEEVLSKKTFIKFNDAKQSSDVINIITEDDLTNGNLFNQSNDKNTWSFKAHNISDFAFAVSDHYLWDGVTAIVDSTLEQKVFTSAAYKKESLDYYKVAEFAKQSIEYFSYELPEIAFPYPSLTVFNGSGGMEYPMMINNGSQSTENAALRLTSHEVAHTYFPFYTGTNEKKYAFMDEGFAVMLPFEFQERLVDSPRRRREALSYQYHAGKELEMPPMIASIFLTGTTYRVASYSRPSLAFYFLEDILGKQLFKESLQEFITLWNGKHPLPYDLFFTFNHFTGMNLNWYLKPWFFEHGFPDLALKNAHQESDSIYIKIRKIGNIPIPIYLELVFEDESIKKIYYSAEVWKEGDDIFEIHHNATNILKEAKIGNDFIPDIDYSNNKIVIH